MFKQAKIFYIHTITPMHVGSGSDLGIVDMPIQREGHTNFPKIEGSSLKGSIRESFELKGRTDVDVLIKTYMGFGYDESNAPSAVQQAFPEKSDKEFAGALGFSDGRILLFPVKSAKGIFAWVTCPLVLNKFVKDLKISDNEQGFTIVENSIPNDSKINIDNGSVILEEYQISIKKDDSTQKIAEFLATELNNEEIKEKLIILSDDDFKDFITLSTEVITRTKIDNKTGVVATGALFTEEYLPSETIMYSLALASTTMVKITQIQNLSTDDEVMEFFTTTIPDIIQIGGNATIGKGIVSIVIGGSYGN
jgi:CRISPR-associated protein Cmr4